MAAANGDDSVPDAWDDTTGGTGDSGMSQAFNLKLNVNAPVFMPGQNVFAPAFVPTPADTQADSSDANNSGGSGNRSVI